MGGNGAAGSLSSAGTNTPGSTSGILFPNARGGAGGTASSIAFGPRSAGGGIIQMTVNGLLTVDGTLSADGRSGEPVPGAGGGVGGSLWLKVGGLAGVGLVSASGGAGTLPNGGGGGGGGIALLYQSNLFTGTLSAKGGTGYVTGGAGTVP